MILDGLIPADMSPVALTAIVVIGFAAGMARGFSGFGSSLIFMPLASSLAAPRLVAAVLLVIDFVAAAPMLPDGWRRADRRATATMVLGALVGVPVGTFALTMLDPLMTRWFISISVLALLALLVSGWRYRGPDHVAIPVGIGALSGFFSGVAQTPGPPVVAYFLGRPVAPTIARANIVLFFFATGLFSLISYSIGGLLTHDALRLSLVIGPAYAVGILVGSQLFGKASESLFRTICFSMIGLSAVIGLPLLDGIFR
jgi:uncharacterized membrane protein YfcA